MKVEEETLRDAVIDALAQSRIDVRDLTVSVADGRVNVKGTVPSQDQRERLREAVERTGLSALLRCEVTVAPVP